MKSNKEHYMMKVNFYDSINDSMLKFAVIIARHNGKWVFASTRKGIHGRHRGDIEKMVRIS